MKTNVQLQQDVLDELQYEPSIEEAGIGVTAKEGIITNREYRPKCGRRKCMKMKISAALLGIAFALVGPATVLAEIPTDGVLVPII
jgi:hypothetical protein